MYLNDLLREKHDDILRLAEAHGAYNVRVFGSVARGEADEKSAIDLLVDMEKGRGLLGMSGLLMYSQDILNHDIDIVTERGLRERMKEWVLGETPCLTKRECCFAPAI